MTKEKGKIETTHLAEMITASEVAKIWRDRALTRGRDIPYTRFSVYAQRGKLAPIKTSLGLLYERERAENIELPRYNPRPDVAKNNKKYTGMKRNKETHQFIKSDLE